MGELAYRRQKGSHESLYDMVALCKNGHKYTPENTRWQKGSSGYLARVCRACDKARKAAPEYLKRRRDRRKRNVMEIGERLGQASVSSQHETPKQEQKL